MKTSHRRALLCCWVLILALLSALPSVASHFRPIQPRPAVDLNPDPDIVEVVLVAHPFAVDFGTGETTVVWTYNGQTPGPMIQAEVGDTLIVHFFNLLPQDTTIHWHGLELPANMDGSNIAQVAVHPGGYFRYQFDLLRASTFWYHPHIRSNEQVEKGLYGALVVRDPAQDQALGLPQREHVLVLDDVLLDEDGQVAEPFPTDPLENALTHLNGREGNHLLTNGKTGSTRTIQRGVPQRLRLINTSNVRFMRVSIPGHRLWRIGGDGGLLEAPIDVQPIGLIPDPDDPTRSISDPDPAKGVLLTPGERADVVFTPMGPKGARIPIEWHDYPRGLHRVFYRPDGSIGLGDADNDGKRPVQTLMTLKLGGDDPGGSEYIPPPSLRDITPIDPTGADPLVVTFGHTPPNAAGDVTFFVTLKDGAPLPFPLVTPDDAPVVTVGETRIWEIHNLTGGDHNFHPHGFVFQPIEIEYVDLDHPENNFVVPAPFLEDKDTIHIPKRPGAMGRSRTIVRMATTFDDTGREGRIVAFGKEPGRKTSGGWVFHCHILEHVDRGMMSFLQVMAP